jgi:predicted cupin superfamily sugar epimerase
MIKTAQYWISRLNLIAHPEGGYYRETYRAELSIPKEALPPQFTGPRLVSTAIYFLLERENFSAFHRLRSDELWHFYSGGPIVVHIIEPDGSYSEIQLGDDPKPVRRCRQWSRRAAGSPPGFAIPRCSHWLVVQLLRVLISRILSWESERI